MDRFWLLTWTTYGTWLPGDPRGSVTSVRDDATTRQEHDHAGMDIDGYMQGLYFSALKNLKGNPVYLTSDQAGRLLAQFQETAHYRQWNLLAIAIMANHVHLVVGVPGDPPSESLMRDFKSYGSRALNAQWDKPESGTWWSSGGGSRRKLPTDEAVVRAVEYVRTQRRALIVWVGDEGTWGLSPGAYAPGLVEINYD